jgi:hypothetical protein
MTVEFPSLVAALDFVKQAERKGMWVSLPHRSDPWRVNVMKRPNLKKVVRNQGSQPSC